MCSGADPQVMVAIHKAWVPTFTATGYPFGGGTHGAMSMHASGHVAR